MARHMMDENIQFKSNLFLMTVNINFIMTENCLCCCTLNLNYICREQVSNIYFGCVNTLDSHVVNVSTQPPVLTVHKITSLP